MTRPKLSTPMGRRLDEKMQELIDNVKNHYSMLEDREVVWVVEHAREALVAEIKKEQRRLIELRQFPSIPRYPGYKPEEPEEDSINEHLRSLHKRLGFIDALWLVLDHQALTNFTVSAAEMFGKDKR